MTRNSFELQTWRCAWLLCAALMLPACTKASETRSAEHPTLSERERRAEVLIEQANGYGAAGDNVRAEQYLNLALTSGGNARRILPLLVEACLRDQRYRDAIQYLEHELRRHPGEQRTRYLLATLHLAVGNSDLARKELERVIVSQPTHADAHYTLAIVFRDDLGNYGEADRHFREYLQLRPDGPRAEEARESLLVSLSTEGK